MTRLDYILPPAEAKKDDKDTKVGIKFDTGKPRMDLLSPVALLELSKVLTYGAGKYAPNNWRKGILFTRLVSAILRHITAYMLGELKDPETGFSHMAHAAASIMFILELEVTRPDLNDLYKPGSDPTNADSTCPNSTKQKNS